jgi:hypothetical protein
MESNNSQRAEEIVDCRIDHYQTPSTVYVTVFAKQTDKERSVVKIGENEVNRPHDNPSYFKHQSSPAQIFFDLHLPGPKRFTRSVQLFGPVDSSTSSFTIFGSKVRKFARSPDHC